MKKIFMQHVYENCFHAQLNSGKISLALIGTILLKQWGILKCSSTIFFIQSMDIYIISGWDNAYWNIKSFLLQFGHLCIFKKLFFPYSLLATLSKPFSTAVPNAIHSTGSGEYLHVWVYIVLIYYNIYKLETYYLTQ